MRKLGIDETLVSPRRWNEGGADVAFTPDGDDFVVAAAYVGAVIRIFSSTTHASSASFYVRARST